MISPRNLRLRLGAADAIQPIEVQPVEERAVHALLQLLVVRLTDIRRATFIVRPPSAAEQMPVLAASFFGDWKPAELPREVADRAGQLAVIGDDQRLAAGDGADRGPIVVGKLVVHRAAKDPLDVGAANVRLRIEAA